MGKLIGKTIAITAAAFVGALAVIFGVLALACPNVVAKGFSELGCYSANVYFLERQYEKTGAYSDLVVLVKSLDDGKDAGRTVKYCEKMVVDKATDFEKYYAGAGKKEFGSMNAAREYFYEKYAIAELNTGDFASAINVATACVEGESGSSQVGGYTRTNPFRALIYVKGDKLTVAQLDALSSAINQLSITDAAELGYRGEDLTAILNIKSEIQSKGE